MRILAIVITYYPEKELMEKNVSAFIDDVNKVLIWENTPESDKLKYRFIEHEKVEYCGDGINSISHGLNYGWHYANNGGYDYLLTMDQDSILINFAAMKEYVKSHIYERIIIGPSLNMGSRRLRSAAVSGGLRAPGPTSGTWTQSPASRCRRAMDSRRILVGNL